MLEICFQKNIQLFHRYTRSLSYRRLIPDAFLYISASRVHARGKYNATRVEGLHHRITYLSSSKADTGINYPPCVKTASADMVVLNEGTEVASSIG